MIHNFHNLKIVFFGTPDFAVVVLEELKTAGIMPTLIVTAPDKPKGRKLVLTPPPVKEWAEKNSIDVAQPAKLKDEVFLEELQNTDSDLFLVASYGKIIPKSILDLPKHGTLNVHPSLLPKLRGPSPIQSSILGDEKETGVSIMLLDEKIDHGPILVQARVALEEWPASTRNSSSTRGWPPKASMLKNILAHEGGKLLAEVIPEWVKGTITPLEQDHSKATYSAILKKEDGLIDLAGDPYKNFLKIRGFDEWPGTYFFVERKGRALMRVKIIDASFENDTLTIKKVVPEGKREMSYDDFLRG